PPCSVGAEPPARSRHPTRRPQRLNEVRHSKRAAVVCPIRARGHLRTHPGQDRRFQTQGPVGRRHGPAKIAVLRRGIFFSNGREDAVDRHIFGSIAGRTCCQSGGHRCGASTTTAASPAATPTALPCNAFSKDVQAGSSAPKLSNNII